MPSIINSDNGSVSGSAGLKSSADSSGVLQLQTNGTTAVTVDASQNVGIGTSSPASRLDLGSSFVNPATNTAADVKLSVTTISATEKYGFFVDSTACLVSLSGSNAGNGSFRWVSGSTERARIDSSGNFGIGNTSPAARIDAFRPTVGTYFLGGGGDNVARQLAIKSSTTTNSGDTHTFDAQSGTGALAFATTSTERARFNSTGALVFAGGTTSADGIGITFPATQSASSDANTLDDYEEGTFSCTITDTGGSGAANMTDNTMKYTKIGNLVYFTGTVSWNSTSAIAAGSRLQLRGLPFNSSNSPGAYRSVVNFGTSTPGSFNVTRPQIAFGIDPNASFVWFTLVSGNNADNGMNKDSIGTGGTIYGISGTYQTA